MPVKALKPTKTVNPNIKAPGCNLPYACQGIETKNPFAMKGFFCYGLTE